MYIFLEQLTFLFTMEGCDKVSQNKYFLVNFTHSANIRQHWTIKTIQCDINQSFYPKKPESSLNMKCIR